MRESVERAGGVGRPTGGVGVEVGVYELESVESRRGDATSSLGGNGGGGRNGSSCCAEEPRRGGGVASPDVDERVLRSGGVARGGIAGEPGVSSLGGKGGGTSSMRMSCARPAASTPICVISSASSNSELVAPLMRDGIVEELERIGELDASGESRGDALDGDSEALGSAPSSGRHDVDDDAGVRPNPRPRPRALGAGRPRPPRPRSELSDPTRTSCGFPEASGDSSPAPSLLVVAGRQVMVLVSE
jgi:hypothetical protein